MSAHVQPLICFPSQPLKRSQQSQRAENKQQFQKSIPLVIGRSTGFVFQDLGLSLAVNGDSFPDELVQPSKPFGTPGSALPEQLQGTGWMQDIHITVVFSSYGYYVQAIAHQFRVKTHYSPWKALLTYLRQQHALLYAWGADGKGCSPTRDPQHSEGEGGYRNHNL